MNKKIYILTEQFMSGSVTIQIISHGIRAESFAIAKDILYANLKKNLPIAKIKDRSEQFTYSTSQLWGIMKNEPLSFLRKP